MIGINHILASQKRLDKCVSQTGAYYKHLNGTRSEHRYAGGNDEQGYASCLSFYTQHNMDCLMTAPKRRLRRATDWEDINTYYKGAEVSSPITDLVFDKFVKYLASFHPNVARCIKSKPPNNSTRELRINSGHGYMNYFMMTQWRLLWNNPQAVYVCVYLYQRGYKWSEILFIQGALREAFNHAGVGKMPNGIPIEYNEYFLGSIPYLENIFNEEDMIAYRFNITMSTACKKNGGGTYPSEYLKASGFKSLYDLRDKRDVIDNMLDLFR